jgi:hypothetical protein
MNNYNLDIGLWCPYNKYEPSNNDFRKGNYSTVVDGPVPPAFRMNNPSTPMPPVPRHGGLFSGPESQNPWNAIPVTPTMTNYIQNNLRSANPPPGATEQYVGTERLGNNYAPMPGTYWYNPTNEMQGKYEIKVTHECDKRTFGPDGMPQQMKVYKSDLLSGNNTDVNVV